ncbi:hypothetical protein K8Z61_15155 [Nocardioides sp. TRM66260-LWL]|uniref:hypothetical protein n=1 Tax=Nocardioides sp. TRM66260-LWL TaxID=2874478 RepID=UPI001CC7FF3B|nr:hypothetical protein [Nocardioides sp. TRM66260-LWL]MBZ5735831.1 hypothetical protein [Nocardioides sp. TRM66260-LWL]
MTTASALFAWEGAPDGVPSRRLVTRCALARVCGACGRPLGHPIAFVGTSDEVARNAFHLPPLHDGCVDAVRALPAPVPLTVVRTAGFEFVRPGSGDADPLPRFVPNSLL